MAPAKEMNMLHAFNGPHLAQAAACLQAGDPAAAAILMENDLGHPPAPASLRERAGQISFESLEHALANGGRCLENLVCDCVGDARTSLASIPWPAIFRLWEKAPELFYRLALVSEDDLEGSGEVGCLARLWRLLQLLRVAACEDYEIRYDPYVGVYTLLAWRWPETAPIAEHRLADVQRLIAALRRREEIVHEKPSQASAEERKFFLQKPAWPDRPSRPVSGQPQTLVAAV